MDLTVQLSITGVKNYIETLKHKSYFNGFIKENRIKNFQISAPMYLKKI